MKPSAPTRLKPWREISILMLIIMEVCWVTPWFRSLTSATYAISPQRVFTVILITVLIAHIFIRSMNMARIKKRVQQVSMVIFILVAIFACLKILLYGGQSTSVGQLLNRPLNSFGDLRDVIPAEFIVIITILVAVWRGVSIAQEHLGPSSVLNHFWLGIIMYVIFIFVNTLATGESPAEFFYLFLFCALVGMVAARMSVIGLLRGGNESKIDRSWLTGMVLAAAGLVSVSALLGGLMGNHLPWIGSLFLGIFGGIMVLLWLLISPLISALIPILQKIFNIQALKGLADSFNNLDQIILGFGRNILDTINQSALSKFLERVGPTLRTIIFIAIIVLVISGVVAWMAIKLWQDRLRREPGTEEKSSLQPGNLLQRMLDLLRNSLAGVSSLAQLTDLSRRQRLRAAARIRRVYAELMELCAALGHPRGKAETPLEFLQHVHQLFPQLQPEAMLITEAYNCIRYGLLPETQQDVDEVEDAWRKISLAGRELAAEKKLSNKKL